MRHSRKEAIAALRRLAQQGPISSGRLVREDNALYTSLRRLWGSLARARRAAGIAVVPNPNQRWTRARVLSEIRALDEAGARMTWDGLRTAGRIDLLAAAKTYVGSWTRARDLAGIEPPPRARVARDAWTAKGVIAEIRGRRRDGEPLAASKVPVTLRSAAVRHLGGWREAIEAAGIDYRSVTLREDLADEELFAWLRATARRYPRWRPVDVEERGQHARKCVRRWGSVAAAASAAGIDGWPVRERSPHSTEEEVVRALRGLARARAPLAYSQVRGGGNLHLLDSAVFRFGSWDAALAAAALPVARLQRPTWTRDEAIAALQERRRQGRSLAPFDVKRDDAAFVRALRRLFGSFEAATKAAGVPYAPKYQRWSDERILRELRRAGRRRKRLRMIDVSSTLAGSAKRRWGTWTAACQAAGLP